MGLHNARHRIAGRIGSRHGKQLFCLENVRIFYNSEGLGVSALRQPLECKQDFPSGIELAAFVGATARSRTVAG